MSANQPTSVDLATLLRELDTSRAECERLGRELAEARDHLIQLGKLNELGRMTASLIHEINQPLAGIKSFAQMVRRKMSESDSQLGKIVAIEEQTAHIESMIDRLRRFSRQAHESREPLDLHFPLHSAIMLLDYRFRRKAITVEQHLARGLPPVAATSTHLQQVFVNLLVNACDAIDDAPMRRIVVATRQTSEGAVEALVGDSGSGVPAAIRDRIFDYFFTTKPEDLGTGVGLAICREIVNGYGGSIELYAAGQSPLPGAPLATVFAVRLPPWHPTATPAAR